jgi:hypothetical protein
MCTTAWCSPILAAAQQRSQVLSPLQVPLVVRADFTEQRLCGGHRPLDRTADQHGAYYVQRTGIATTR